MLGPGLFDRRLQIVIVNRDQKNVKLTNILMEHFAHQIPCSVSFALDDLLNVFADKLTVFLPAAAPAFFAEQLQTCIVVWRLHQLLEEISA